MLAVALLANVEGDVPILDHVADLSLHRDREQNAEVNQEDGPEHRDVKYPEQRAKERNQYCLRSRVPVDKIEMKSTG